MVTTRFAVLLLSMLCAGLGACSNDAGQRQTSTAAQVVLPKPAATFSGKIGTTYKDSTPAFPRPVAARAVGSLRAGPQHANPMGTLHGGVLCDLADAAMGMAFVSTLAPDESFTTMGLSIHFFRPVWQADLRAEARVVNRGRTIGYVECDVLDQDGRQIAKASSTCIVLRGEHARQR
jgi:uncharacterized protein (TIGR00369 family)